VTNVSIYADRCGTSSGDQKIEEDSFDNVEIQGPGAEMGTYDDFKSVKHIFGNPV
jgi:hypothetical protein